MSNELLLVVAIGVAMTAILVGRFMILGDPTTALLQRAGQVVRESDPDLLARLSLQELQRPAALVPPSGGQDGGGR